MKSSRPPQKGNPALIVLSVVAGVLAVCVVVGVIGGILTGSGDDEPSAQPTGDLSSAAAAVGIPPMPDKATQDAYIAALKAIDPDIVAGKDPQTIVNRGRDQCASIKDHAGNEAKLIELTNKRFTSPDHPDGFGEEKAKQILAVVRKHICPTY